MKMKLNIRKINRIIIGSPGKAILGVDLYFQMKGLLNYLDYFDVFQKCLQLKCVHIYSFLAFHYRTTSTPHYLNNNNNLTMQRFTYCLATHS